MLTTACLAVKIVSMNEAKKVLLPIAAVFFLLLFVGLFLKSDNLQNGLVDSLQQNINNTKVVEIGGVKVSVQVADTKETRMQGLSGVDSLSKNQGMFFVFDEAGKPIFWMKNMNFAIDIFWIENGQVVGIEKNVQPEPGRSDADLTGYNPPTEITYVLEVNAGFADENNIEVGDSVILPENL